VHKKILYTTIVYIMTFNLYLPVNAQSTISGNDINYTVQEDKNENFKNDIISLNRGNYTKIEYLKRYKLIINKYKDLQGVPKTLEETFTPLQIKYMEKCIETEAFECSFASKVNHANVIFNRLDNPKIFSDNPIKIIKKPNQFKYGRNIISDDTVQALEYAFYFPDTTYGSTLFESGGDNKLSKYGDSQFTDDSNTTYYVIKKD